MRQTIRRIISSLRFRLLLLVLLACAPLVALTFRSASEERRRLVKDWELRSQSMMEQAAREEGRVINQTRQLLITLAESAQVRLNNRRDAKKLLDEMFGSYPRYANLGVVGTNGAVLASALPVAEPVNQAKLSYFHRTLTNGVFTMGEYPSAPMAGKPTVQFGQPVFDAFGQVQAVVFAVLDLDWVARFESALPAQLPAGATWSMIDRGGRIIVRHPEPEKWIGQKFEDTNLLQAAFSQERGVIEADSGKGVAGYYAFARMRSQLVPDESVAMLGSIPRPVLFVQADRRLTGELTGLAVAAVLAVAIGWVGSGWLVLRPVRALVRSSARLAAGEFTVRTGLHHHDSELGQLTRTFDEMARTLEEREAGRQRAEQELRQSEQRFRALVQNSADVIGITDARGIILYRSPSLHSTLGYDASEVVGKSIAHYLWPEDLTTAQTWLAELVKSPGITRRGELRLRHRDGSCRVVECTCTNHLADPAIGGIVFNCRDITKRKQAEEKLEESRQRLQVLSRRLVEAQEAERRRIALELHDEIGQALTAAEMSLQAALQTPGHDALKPRLQASLAAVERVLEEAHDLALNLRPSMLDDLGLKPALVWLTHRQADLAGLRGEVQGGAWEGRLDPVIETACFRIAQEALTNVVRHARARAVTVTLDRADGQLHLCVSDDGAGFDAAAVRSEAVRGLSLGMLSMEERAMLVGGRLECRSTPGEGTEIHAWLPLKVESITAELEVT